MESWTDNTFTVIILGFITYYVLCYCLPAWADRVTQFARRYNIINGPTVLDAPANISVHGDESAAAGDATFFNDIARTLSAIWPRGEPILADPATLNAEDEVDEDEMQRDQELYRQFKEIRFQDDDDDENDPDFTPTGPISGRQRSSYSLRFRGFVPSNN